MPAWLWRGSQSFQIFLISDHKNTPAHFEMEYLMKTESEFLVLKKKTRELDKLRKKIANTEDKLTVEKLRGMEVELKREIKTMARLVNIRLSMADGFGL